MVEILDILNVQPGEIFASARFPNSFFYIDEDYKLYHRYKHMAEEPENWMDCNERLYMFMNGEANIIKGIFLSEEEKKYLCALYTIGVRKVRLDSPNDVVYLYGWEEGACQATVKVKCKNEYVRFIPCGSKYNPVLITTLLKNANVKLSDYGVTE